MAELELPPAPSVPWATSRTIAEPAAGQPAPLAETEVCVVGAGVAGLVMATMLADEGRSVTVLDARHPGFGTTGRSSAKVTVLHGHAAERIAHKRGVEAALTYLAANTWGFEWLRKCVQDLGDCSWEVRPAVTYALDDERAAAVARECDLLTSAGVNAELRTLDMAWGTHPAVVCTDQAQLDPVRLVDRLVSRLHERGVVVRSGTMVSGVTERPGHVQIETSQGEVRADHLVAATNLPFLDRGLHFARTVPRTSHVVGVTVGDPPAPGMYLGVGNVSRSIRTAPGRETGRVLLVGGEGHRTGAVADTLRRQRRLLDWARTHFDVQDVVHRFSAEDYTTPDHIPFAGPILPRSRRIHVLTGFNKWGFTNAPAAAAAVAARIVRPAEPTPWSELYDATRLPRSGVSELTRSGARVARHGVTDWTTSIVQDVRRPGRPVGGGPERPCVASGVCTHLGGIVRWNNASRTWDCPLHGSTFDEEGRVVHGPATAPLRRCYEPPEEKEDDDR